MLDVPAPSCTLHTDCTDGLATCLALDFAASSVANCESCCTHVNSGARLQEHRQGRAAVWPSAADKFVLLFRVISQG